jgi:ATP-dependent helicase/nuclease subunit B
VEQKGVIEIPAPAGMFSLSGTADRIDRHVNGDLSIVDYKTGAPPSVKEVESGMSPQLALEAAMVARNGFPGLTGGSVEELLYIRLSGSDPAGEVRDAGKDMSPDEQARSAYEGVLRLIAQFDREATPYLTRPRPDFIDRFNEYEHLARLKEWSSGVGDE